MINPDYRFVKFPYPQRVLLFTVVSAAAAIVSAAGNAVFGHQLKNQGVGVAFGRGVGVVFQTERVRYFEADIHPVRCFSPYNLWRPRWRDT